MHFFSLDKGSLPLIVSKVSFLVLTPEKLASSLLLPTKQKYVIHRKLAR